jgi:hypothetical protein
VFQYMKELIVNFIGGTGAIIIWFLNSYLELNIASKVTNLSEWKAIILQLFYTVDVSSILPRKVAFYQLKQCHIPQGLDHELLSWPFPSITPLTAKHCDRNLLTFAPIIAFFMFWSPLPSNFEELTFNFRCLTLVSPKLTIAR